MWISLAALAAAGLLAFCDSLWRGGNSSVRRRSTLRLLIVLAVCLSIGVEIIDRRASASAHSEMLTSVQRSLDRMDTIEILIGAGSSDRHHAMKFATMQTEVNADAMQTGWAEPRAGAGELGISDFLATCRVGVKVTKGESLLIFNSGLTQFEAHYATPGVGEKPGDVTGVSVDIIVPASSLTRRSPELVGINDLRGARVDVFFLRPDDRETWRGGSIEEFLRDVHLGVHGVRLQSGGRRLYVGLKRVDEGDFTGTFTGRIPTDARWH